MNTKKAKFLKFLESLDSETDKLLIESIRNGFQAILEEEESPEMAPKANSHLIRTTYDIVTPESAENGEAAEQGWIDEEGISMEPDEFDLDEGISVVDKTVQFLKKNGATEFSGNRFSPWFTNHEYNHDYKSGAEESRSFHLVGYSDDELSEIVAQVK